MGITRGFGTMFDLERGTSRSWVMGRDGIKRWVDSNDPAYKKPDPQEMHRALKVIYTWASVDGALVPEHVMELVGKVLSKRSNYN